jgi:FkbM family methyltransferase
MYSEFEWTEISLVRNCIQRAYEPLQIYFFTQLARYVNGRSFLDVGANVGSYSLAMASVDSIETVIAFEPMPSLYKELTKNVQLNHLSDKIISNQIALSNRSGSVQFGVIGNYSGANGIVDTLSHQDANFDTEISVSAESLDSISRRKMSVPVGPCMVKIDVEGHEAVLLAGAFEFLENDCLLQVEVFSEKTRLSEIDSLLAEHGYRRFWEIGDDRYYAKPNRCPSTEELLVIVSRAHLAMIDDFRKIDIPGIGPERRAITRRIGPVQISLLDPVAGWLRRIAGQ